MATSSKPGASPNAQAVYNSLRARGYSTAASSAVIGNLQQESGVNPTSQQPGGAGRGIAQWSQGQRWTTENQYASTNKESPWSLTTQTGFLEQEMGQMGLGPGSSFAKSTNVSGATQTFESTYERAGTPEESQRAAYAQNAYAAFSGNKVGAVTKAPASTAPGKKAAPQNPILGGISDAFSGAASLSGDAASGAGDVLGDAASAVTTPVQAITKVTGTVFSVSFWIRAAFIMVGLGLVFIGTKALLNGGSTLQLPKPATATPVTKAPSTFGKDVKRGAEVVGA